MLRTAAARLLAPSRARLVHPRAHLATITWSTDSSSTSPAVPSAAPSTTPLHHAVMSISGEDRPGILSSVSSAVSEKGANVRESKMAILGGDFAMIVYVSLQDAADAEQLATSLRQQLPTFSVSIRTTTAGPQVSESGEVRSSWALSLEGPDSPGILAAVSEALAVNGANVHEIETETTTAPFAGYQLFKLNGSVSVDERRLDALAERLDKVENKFGISIYLKQMDD